MGGRGQSDLRDQEDLSKQLDQEIEDLTGWDIYDDDIVIERDWYRYAEGAGILAPVGVRRLRGITKEGVRIYDEMIWKDYIAELRWEKYMRVKAANQMFTAALIAGVLTFTSFVAWSNYRQKKYRERQAKLQQEWLEWCNAHGVQPDESVADFIYNWVYNRSDSWEEIWEAMRANPSLRNYLPPDMR